MTWTTAVTDLRSLLSDGPTDKHRYRKRVFGELNGVNKTFKTFEFRRITSFAGATPDAAPLGVYLGGVRLDPATAITADYPGTGEFVLAAAPADDGKLLEASYFVQWFLDSELTGFLSRAAQWLGMGGVYANLEDGLQPAALKYAASEAYQKMAVRWREHLSETFRLEDSPRSDDQEQTNEYLELAKHFRKDAESSRNDFYSRSGQANAPLYRSISGRVREVMPKT